MGHRFKTWRDQFRPRIAQILAENAGEDEKTLQRALRKAWPLGERKYFPYKVWLDEIKVQRGLRVFRGRQEYKPAPPKQHKPADNQLGLELNP